ncbi:MAG TPA: hypothetical protein VKY24_16170 [Reyranella sp.]|nr:hypothetical protein [Reyranella sp.]
MAKDQTGIDRVVSGTPNEMVDLAKRQIFASAAKIGSVPPSAPRRDLQRVLCELLDSEISAGLQTFPFCSFHVWIGDDVNGIEAVGTFEDESIWKDSGAIAHWLHETAIRLYPDSAYANAHR